MMTDRGPAGSTAASPVPGPEPRTTQRTVGTSAVPVTGKELTRALAGLGLGDGDVVLVHASLSSLGFVVGGALTVVQALLDAVGGSGTIVAPTFTAGNCDPARWAVTRGRAVPEPWWPTVRESLPAFDPGVTPSENMGAVAELVRTWPGAVRSAHPQTSFASVGAAALPLMRNHPWTCHLGPGTPLARLAARTAKILLLGVSYRVCTAFHLAEYQQVNPPLRDYECVVGENGRTRWFRYHDVLLDDSDFEQIGRALEGSDNTVEVNAATIGSGTARLIPMDVCVSFAREWIATHRRRP